MNYQLLQGDCLTILRTLPAASVHCCVTSPPYFGLRDYGHAGQIGLERTVGEYVAKLVEVFAEVRRVLRADGTFWLNLGDSYAGNRGNTADKPGFDNKAAGNGANFNFKGGGVPAGLKPKDLIGIPWRVAFALQDDGWYLRSDIIWHKPNPMPESVTDRPTKAHEYLFLLAKQERYFYDADAIKEPSIYPDDNRKLRSTPDQKRMPTNEIAGVRPGNATYSIRNRRSVWSVTTEPYSGAHFATMPSKLVEPAILAGTSAHGVCSACGAPWVREVERIPLSQLAVGADNANPKHKKRIEMGLASKKSGLFGANSHNASTPQSPIVKTLGWLPSCSCHAGIVPATVLDPFNGSGTTGSVAISLGREYIGIEINPDYIKLAHKRICETQPALL